MPCSQKTLLSSDAYWEHTEICMAISHAVEQSSLYNKWVSTVYAIDNTLKSHS